MHRKLKLGDLYAGTFLELNGIIPDLEVVRDKTLLGVPADDHTYQLLTEFNTGTGQCSALDFVEHMKALRARMMDARRGGGAR